jgi:predicted MFS family arabinose efflux permease
MTKPPIMPPTPIPAFKLDMFQLIGVGGIIGGLVMTHVSVQAITYTSAIIGALGLILGLCRLQHVESHRFALLD